jgi:hypothetical protein
VKPIFFAAPEEFRAWLEAHHETGTEVLVGYRARRLATLIEESAAGRTLKQFTRPSKP